MTRTESKHFTFERLAEGVYAAFHREGGWATANAGVVDPGDGVLVFDTFLTPDAAADLKAVAMAVTGKPVAYVLNSHFHNDHIWSGLRNGAGNQAVSKRGFRGDGLKRPLSAVY